MVDSAVMTSVPRPFPDRFIPSAPRAKRRRRAALSLLAGVAILAASVYVYASMLSPVEAYLATPAPPVLGGLQQRSYVPGQIALLQFDTGSATRAKLQVFLAGAIK